MPVYFIVGEVGFIHHGMMTSLTYDVVFYTRIVKVDFMCFILFAHFFSLLFFLNEYRDDKNQCFKCILIHIILDTGLNSHAYSFNTFKFITIHQCILKETRSVNLCVYLACSQCYYLPLIRLLGTQVYMCRQWTHPRCLYSQHYHHRAQTGLKNTHPALQEL